MKKFMLILLLIFYCQYAWAEIREYTLDQIEVADGTGNVKNIPILDAEHHKPMISKLLISGLGTSRVTAQCPTLSLAVETQIYPLEKNNGTGKNNSNWYYTAYSLGVTVIEIQNDGVKVYNLGDVTYTYVGKRNEDVTRYTTKEQQEPKK